MPSAGAHLLGLHCQLIVHLLEEVHDELERHADNGGAVRAWRETWDGMGGREGGREGGRVSWVRRPERVKHRRVRETAVVTVTVTKPVTVTVTHARGWQRRACDRGEQLAVQGEGARRTTVAA
jgi:hypothetical protein